MYFLWICINNFRITKSVSSPQVNQPPFHKISDISDISNINIIWLVQKQLRAA